MMCLSLVYYFQLSDTIFDELILQIKKVKAEIANMSNNPQGLLLEAIHAAGYSGALANPLLAPESALNRLSSTILEEFVSVR